MEKFYSQNYLGEKYLSAKILKRKGGEVFFRYFLYLFYVINKRRFFKMSEEKKTGTRVPLWLAVVITVGFATPFTFHLGKYNLPL